MLRILCPYHFFAPLFLVGVLFFPTASTCVSLLANCLPAVRTCFAYVHVKLKEPKDLYLLSTAPNLCLIWGEDKYSSSLDLDLTTQL